MQEQQHNINYNGNAVNLSCLYLKHLCCICLQHQRLRIRTLLARTYYIAKGRGGKVAMREKKFPMLLMKDFFLFKKKLQCKHKEVSLF